MHIDKLVMSQRKEPSQTDSLFDEEERIDFDETYASLDRSTTTLVNMLAAHKPGNVNQYCYIVQVTGKDCQPNFRHNLWGQKGKKTGYVLKIGFALRGAGPIDRIVDHIYDLNGKVRLIGLLKGATLQDESRMKQLMQLYCMQEDKAKPIGKALFSNEWWVYDYNNIKKACVAMSNALVGATDSLEKQDREGSDNLKLILCTNPTRMTEDGIWFGKDCASRRTRDGARLPMKIYQARFSAGKQLSIPKLKQEKNLLAKATKVGHYIKMTDRATRKKYTSMINQIAFSSDGKMTFMAQWDDVEHPERNTTKYEERLTDFGKSWFVHYPEIKFRHVAKSYNNRTSAGLKRRQAPPRQQAAAAAAAGPVDTEEEEEKQRTIMDEDGGESDSSEDLLVNRGCEFCNKVILSVDNAAAVSKFGDGAPPFAHVRCIQLKGGESRGACAACCNPVYNWQDRSSIKKVNSVTKKKYTLYYHQFCFNSRSEDGRARDRGCCPICKKPVIKGEGIIGSDDRGNHLHKECFSYEQARKKTKPVASQYGSEFSPEHYGLRIGSLHRLFSAKLKM